MIKFIVFFIYLNISLGYCQDVVTQTDLFTAGDDGYHTFRIPSLITTPNDTVLAFCEGRVNSISDAGDIDIVLKRSSDNGAIWSDLQVVIGTGDAVSGFGNPTAVIDASTGYVWLLLRWVDMAHGLPREQRMYVTHSQDDGVTWEDTTDITTDVTLFNDYIDGWDWFVPGPGVGIQCDSGRLLIPGDCRYQSGDSLYSYTFFSDDNGTTWEMGGLAGSSGQELDECQLVELTDGTIMLNARNESEYKRAIATSTDEGETWSAVTFDATLIDPSVMGSIIRYDASNLLFSNPASTTARVNMTIRRSIDDGSTWVNYQPVHPGPSAYSCLAKLPDDTIGCLYEYGTVSFREKVVFIKFSMDWLTQEKTLTTLKGI